MSVFLKDSRTRIFVLDLQARRSYLHATLLSVRVTFAFDAAHATHRYTACKDTLLRGPSVWDQLSTGPSSRATNAAHGEGSRQGGGESAAATAAAAGAGDGRRGARGVVPVADSLGALGPDATLRSVAMVTLSVDSIETSSVRRTVVDSATGAAVDHASSSSSVSQALLLI